VSRQAKEIKAMTNTIPPSSIALARSPAAVLQIVAKVSGTSSDRQKRAYYNPKGRFFESKFLIRA
jgi:hypothetical protein